jgi:hypothetical protein
MPSRYLPGTLPHALVVVDALSVVLDDSLGRVVGEPLVQKPLI